MSSPQKQKDREKRRKRKHRKPTMSEIPIPTTKVFKDKRRKSRQEDKINLKKEQKTLDSYQFFFVYSYMRNERITNKRGSNE